MGTVARVCGVLLVLSAVRTPAQVQQTKPGAPVAPVHLTSEQDHQRIMDLLHITSLRRGPDGDPKSPNAANVDESKVAPYSLPDPLRLKNGKKVESAVAWWNQRRPEIVEDFDREVYGRMPKNTPRVTWEVKSTTKEMNGDVPVITKELVGHVDNSAYPLVTVDVQLTLSTPANAGPVPVMLEIGLSAEMRALLAKRFPQPPTPGPTWQQQVLAKGWGYANIVATSVQADNGEGLTQGIIGLVNRGQPRQLDDWGALRAWTWGASRALDYFETDKAVDAKQVGIEGLSRYGKAALVAMAYDPRFAIGFIGSSGEGGAKILRRGFGEQVENLAAISEYHWMAGNFLKYAGPLTPNDLPVDAHELIALCAPRPVFISSGSLQVEGGWIDGKGMFLAAVGAGVVYRLLGKKDLGTDVFPPMETALIDGEIAFRQHSGGHTTGPNWPTFLNFASRYIKVKENAVGATGDTGNSLSPDLQLTPQDVLETHGLSVLLFHNAYHGVFGDEKMSGMEIILHDQRIATNGDVRLSATPAQWDPIPQFKARTRGVVANSLSAACSYANRGLSYRIDVQPDAGGFRVAVQLDQPLPANLIGKAGFNLEFLPTAYFGKSFIVDDDAGIFPRHPDGPMEKESEGANQPVPLATGHQIVLSPEDPLTRVKISSDTGSLMLFDGRNQAQNGWFVVRSLIPAGKTTDVVVWHIQPNLLPNWRRPPVVAYNQVGYTPARAKVAVIELDSLQDAPTTARVLRILPSGEYKEAYSGEVKPWGKWMCYKYARFDFSTVREPGIYAIEFAGHINGPFHIANHVYDGIWHASLDTYLAVQMDHVKVREAYRIWHGASHLDDARQAPVNYTHFDGYAQGPTTDSPFAPGEHIPGLNSGGWYDAGDYDLRTQTQATVITDLALAIEKFGLNWDDTTVDERARYVQMRRPDGVPDAIQQIEHGVTLLLAEHRIFGHAIPGIIEPTLEEYTHLGDAASQTDGKIYSATLGPLETDGIYSGIPDDRWAFTTHTTPLNYDAIASLAAASRVLGAHNAKMAAECLQVAERVWDEEHKQTPALFRSFNTTGSDLQTGETKAAVELLLATKGGEIYRKRLKELLPVIEERVGSLGGLGARALPSMDAEFKTGLRSAVLTFKAKLDAELEENPYGVPIARGTWGGSGQVAGFASELYFLHEAFPEIVGTEYTLRGIDYVLGTHPVSNVSLVSAVGTESKLIAYGNNRADYTFIPGGMVPGVTILQPDFPELTAAWPFLWYENEYVVDTATAFILAANAANALAK